jgi:hypothetical protein
MDGRAVSVCTETGASVGLRSLSSTLRSKEVPWYATPASRSTPSVPEGPSLAVGAVGVT